MDIRATQSVPERSTSAVSRIGEILCRYGYVTDDQMESALMRQQAQSPQLSIGEVLIDMGVVSREVLSAAVADSVRIPYMKLDINDINPDAIAILPVDFIEEHNILPMQSFDECAIIAMERFTDICLIDDIERCIGMAAIVVAADAQEIREMRRSILGQVANQPHTIDALTAGELDRALEQLNVEELQIVERFDSQNEDENGIAEDDTSPIVRLVRCIIQDAARLHASDIHVEPIESGCRVRYRVDGELFEKVRLSSRVLPPLVSRMKILARLDISERRLPQDGAITVSLANRRIDLRISTMATKFGEKVVMRIADPFRHSSGLDDIGLSVKSLEKLRSLICEAHGIVIVTGPTGSGKTTTLYAALSEILDATKNVSTIEDPVERRLDGANQFQVNKAADFTFARALRSLLRQDPDVLMVGEIRDVETARLATEAALTGHLVLTTLHTNDAPTAIPRLINMGIEPYLVAASLRGVLAQQLVRKLCPYCIKSARLSGEQRQILAELCRGPCPIDEHYVSCGCARCDSTGYSGRVGVFEMLQFNESDLGAMIRHGDGERSIRQRLYDSQNAMLHDGVSKVAQGLITIDGLLAIVSRVGESVLQDSNLCNDVDSPNERKAA